MMYPARVIERVLSNTERDESGCLVSRYSVASHGYAQVGWNEDGKRTVTVCHRIAWTAEHGEIPAGMVVDHLCRNRKCVDVSHLRLLSNFDNARRTFGRDWPLGQCIRGHDDSELRVYGGRRVCRLCDGERQRAYRARKATVRSQALTV